MTVLKFWRWGSSYSFEGTDRSNLNQLANKTKSQIQDLQWGTACACIAAEAHWAGSYGQSSSEMLIHSYRVLLCRIAAGSVLNTASFTILGGFFAPHSHLFYHLSPFTHLPCSKSSWKELRGTLPLTVSLLRTGVPLKTLDLTNRGEEIPHRWKKYKPESHMSIFKG